MLKGAALKEAIGTVANRYLCEDINTGFRPSNPDLNIAAPAVHNDLKLNIQ